VSGLEPHSIIIQVWLGQYDFGTHGLSKRKPISSTTAALCPGRGDVALTVVSQTPEPVSRHRGTWIGLRDLMVKGCEEARGRPRSSYQGFRREVLFKDKYTSQEQKDWKILYFKFNALISLFIYRSNANVPSLQFQGYDEDENGRAHSRV
jgi:hypothetical protein